MRLLNAEIGRRLKKYRVEKGISQMKLGLQIGLDRTYIAKVENGDGNVSVNNLAKIAAGLDITLVLLFVGIELNEDGTVKE